jgi:hypothetical protein
MKGANWLVAALVVLLVLCVSTEMSYAQCFRPAGGGSYGGPVYAPAYNSYPMLSYGQQAYGYGGYVPQYMPQTMPYAGSYGMPYGGQPYYPQPYGGPGMPYAPPVPSDSYHPYQEMNGAIPSRYGPIPFSIRSGIIANVH